MQRRGCVGGIGLLCVIVLMFSRAAAQDRVGIRCRKIVVPRAERGSTAQDDARIQVPVLSGLTNKTLLRRLQKAVLPQEVFKGSLAALKQDPWLTDVDYIVNCNRHYVLDVSYRISGVAAYPDSYDEHITLDLKTGKPLRAGDLFRAAALPKLAAMVNRAMQSDIRKSIQGGDKDLKPELQERLSHLVFTAKDLTEFTVSAQGVTFYYTFDFPHVIKSAEPDGRYFFSFAALRSLVRHDGPLAAFLH